MDATVWGELLKLTVTLIAIVDPVASIPVFLAATDGLSNAERRRVARVVSLTVFMVLAAAILGGAQMLGFFGISIASFMIGGGILFLMLAVSMLQAKGSWIRQNPDEAMEATEREGVAIVPLAVPLLAGPGAITTLIIETHESPGLLGQLLLLLPAAAIAGIVWLALSAAEPLLRRLGRTGMNIITRIMGLIIAAIAIEYIYRGLVALFPKLV